jgi:hypothetical protein
MSYENRPIPSTERASRLRRAIMLSTAVALSASLIPLIGPAHADPAPCEALITVPKPPPVPFPSPKPSPVTSGSISGYVGGTIGGSVLGNLGGITVTLFRCNGSAGTSVGNVMADSQGAFNFANLDASFDYYVEAAIPPVSILGPVLRLGAYAVPGMQDVGIFLQQ